MSEKKTENIQSRVEKIVIDVLAPAKPVTLESRLEEDLQADDFDLFDIGMMIEDEFDVDDFPDEDVRAWETMKDIIDYVTKKLA